VSLICCFHAERGKACADTAAVYRRAARGSVSSSMTCKKLSTVAARAGGPARSSGEVPASRGGDGAKGPDHLWLVCWVNRELSGRS
jgi:hypothetical protein